MKREFLILGKKGCYYTEKIINFLEKHKDKYTKTVKYVNYDFQEKEFKDMFGEKPTYPKVFEVKINGKKIFMGGADDTEEKLKKNH